MDGATAIRHRARFAVGIYYGSQHVGGPSYYFSCIRSAPASSCTRCCFHDPNPGERRRRLARTKYPLEELRKEWCRIQIILLYSFLLYLFYTCLGIKVSWRDVAMTLSDRIRVYGKGEIGCASRQRNEKRFRSRSECRELRLARVMGCICSALKTANFCETTTCGWLQNRPTIRTKHDGHLHYEFVDTTAVGAD